MIRDVTPADVHAYAATRETLNVRDFCRHFKVGFERAEQLLALAARGLVKDEDPPLSAMEIELINQYRFSATEARAAQRMIINGEIHHG